MPLARVVLLSSLLSLGLSTAASFQDTLPSDSPVRTLSGRVVTAYADSLVIETEAGDEQAFVMDANVRVPAEATPGRRVSVTYRSPGGARAYAVGVRVIPDETPPPARPRAASPLPLAAVLGLMALVGSALLRAASGRVD